MPSQFAPSPSEMYTNTILVQEMIRKAALIGCVLAESVISQETSHALRSEPYEIGQYSVAPSEVVARSLGVRIRQERFRSDDLRRWRPDEIVHEHDEDGHSVLITSDSCQFAAKILLDPQHEGSILFFRTA